MSKSMWERTWWHLAIERFLASFLVQKVEVRSQFKLHFELHFSKSQLFSFFLPYNPFGVSCGLEFFLTQLTRLEEPFKYLEHTRKVHRKFSREFWKKFQLKVWTFVRIFHTHIRALRAHLSVKTLIFWSFNVKNYIIIFMQCFIFLACTLARNVREMDWETSPNQPPKVSALWSDDVRGNQCIAS